MRTVYNPTMRKATSTWAVALAACALAAPAAGWSSQDRAAAAPSPGLPQGSEPVNLDPADFTTRIDNPYWPMRPGSRWVYRESSDEGPPNRIVVTVTNRTKRVAAGVVARVIHDRATQAGRVVEDTQDWYAQDSEGNIWYLGEATKAYKRGRVSSTKGSWEAGVDGAQAGVIMPAHPRVGMTYRQEYRRGVAEDRGSVLSLGKRVKVPAGSFAQVLTTRDWTPLEPDAAEHKSYARGTGPVLSLDVTGGGREELLRFTRGGR
ncbi:MAG: hypothetical protein QOE31_3523 [Solirubrobacteraceae bacterium]|jgi:hypothetical protein|nr:hypothetical protein [Solirubrobacteraceae bacterium]